MKLTKQQIKQLIKEEIRTALQEQTSASWLKRRRGLPATGPIEPGASGTPEEWTMRHLNTIIEKLDKILQRLPQ